MTATSTVLVTDTCMYLPGRQVRGTRPNTFDGGLPGFIGRIADRLTDDGLTEGVVMLDAYAAAALHLPATLGQIDDPADNPATIALRKAGWKVTRLREWTILYSAAMTRNQAGWRPTIHLGVLPWIFEQDTSRCPLIARDHASTVQAFELWRELVGTPYHGTPGVAGISAMREQATAGERAKGPTWQPKQTGPRDGYERDYNDPSEGGSPDFLLPMEMIPSDHKYLIGYDAKRMYLAAMGSALVCPWTLKPTGADVEWTPELAGWWLITPAPWQDKRLPDPAGYPHKVDEDKRWVTAPTLSLIHELMDEGIHGGYVVHDSYTGPAKRVNRQWYERQRAAWKSPRIAPDPTALDYAARMPVQAALKACYRETNGMLNAPESRIKRPDWHFATIAQARSNLWRRIRRVGDRLDRWPLYINVDCLFYTAETSDAEAEAPTWVGAKGKPEGIVIGDNPGQFTVKHLEAL